MAAVEQFFKDLCDLGFIEYPDDAIVQNRLNLALEMEKEQIEIAKKEGYNFATSEAIKEIHKNYNQ